MLSLEPAEHDAVRLVWEGTPGALYRLCVTHDRARREPYTCFGVGRGSEAYAGVPAEDGAQYLLSLQACWLDGEECSQPVDAGTVGRRSRGDFDFYATALLLSDGRAMLGGYSLRPSATIAYHQARPGRPDQRRSACVVLGEGACGTAVLALPGSLAGVSQEIPGVGSAALTFELRDPPHAALLFDDGTGQFTGNRLTAQVILDEYGVKGNFFIVGTVMRDHPTAIRALVAAGHRVGNHSFSHARLTQLTDAQIVQELDATEAQYRAAVPGGTTKPCFRAPHGAIDRRVGAVVAARGYRQINWTVSAEDYSGVSAERIIRDVLGQVRDGALISFHTWPWATLTALRTIIPVMQSWGYVFDIVC